MTTLSDTCNVVLRDVIERDLPTFFNHQLDPDATRMAAFPSRDRESFMAHWARILDDGTVITKTILCNGQIAGNIASYALSGQTHVGYWIGKDYWGKGIATSALSAFLDLVPVRPLYGRIAEVNPASVRVLEKCGLTFVEEAPDVDGAGDEEIILILC